MVNEGEKNHDQRSGQYAVSIELIDGVGHKPSLSAGFAAAQLLGQTKTLHTQHQDMRSNPGTGSLVGS